MSLMKKICGDIYRGLVRKNRYVGLIDVVRQLFLGLPREISIELTNDCNLKCAKCPTYETNRVRGHFDAAVYKKIINDISAAGRGGTTLVFTGAGEATLHPEIVSFVSMAKAVKRIKHIKLITNALDLTPDLTRQLVTAGVDSINVSLDTLDRTKYLKFNRVDGLDKVLSNIDFLVGNKGRTTIHLKVTLYQDDQKFISEIKNKYKNCFDSIRFSGLHNWLGLRGKQKPSSEKPICPYPFYQMQVLWDGQITLCCHDCMEGKINLGNVKDVSVLQHWHSRKMVAHRFSQISGNMNKWPVCRSCDAHLYEVDREL